MRHTSPNMHSKVTSHLLMLHNCYEACTIGQTLGTRKLRNAPACSLRTEGDLPGPLSPLLHPSRPRDPGITTTPPAGPRPPPGPIPGVRQPPPAPLPPIPARLSAGRPDTGHCSSDSIPASPPRLRLELSNTSVHLPHGSLNPEQWRPLNRSSLGRSRLAEKRLAGVSQQTPAR